MQHNNGEGRLCESLVSFTLITADTLCTCLFNVCSLDGIIGFMKTDTLPDCSWLYPRSSEQLLQRGGHLINICWMNESNGTYGIGLLTAMTR